MDLIPYSLEWFGNIYLLFMETLYIIVDAAVCFRNISDKIVTKYYEVK